MLITSGCCMADMVFVVSSWKEEQDMTKVDKACLGKPQDGESVRARGHLHVPGSTRTDLRPSHRATQQSPAPPQEWCPALFAPCAPRLGHPLGLFRYGLRQLSFITFRIRTAILQLRPLLGSGAICPFPCLALTSPARVAHPSVRHVLSPIMATIFSWGHSLGQPSPSPWDPRFETDKLAT